MGSLIYGNGILRYQGTMKADEMNGTGTVFFAATNTVQYLNECKSENITVMESSMMKTKM